VQYLPDFKFWTPESSQRYAKAKDYPERAREAIKEMHRQVRVARPALTLLAYTFSCGLVTLFDCCQQPAGSN
jgi:uncharacterized Fe-S radical SAM superfamily protein PflX